MTDYVRPSMLFFIRYRYTDILTLTDTDTDTVRFMSGHDKALLKD